MGESKNITVAEIIESQEDFEDVVRDFVSAIKKQNKLHSKGQGKAIDMVAVYYAGHGGQVKNKAGKIDGYMLCTGYPEDDGKIELADLDEYRWKLKEFALYLTNKLSNVQIKSEEILFMVDACRENLKRSGIKGATRAAIPTEAFAGMATLYSVEEGKLANDAVTCQSLKGYDRAEFKSGSPFAVALAHNLKPGVSMFEVLKQVRKDVKALTMGDQCPHINLDTAEKLQHIYL